MEEEKVLEPIIFTHEELGEIRTFKKDEKILFSAADVCEKLDIQNTSQAVEDFDEDEKADISTKYISSNGVIQNRTILAVTEPGLYKLIFRSRKPEAKKFQHWVFHEVLPALRKTGSYTMPGHDDAKNIIFNFGSDNMSAASLKKGCGEELGRLSRMLGHMDALNPAQLYLMNEATLCITGHYIPTLEEFTFTNYYGDENKKE